ncbi:MAG: hypothetical protein QXK01_08890 [Thermofilum sp.]|uniref:hypothetical protein n=1 Tax=Thermofilum sp. TaxID=1961369 RepID=UPI003165D6E3
MSEIEVRSLEDLFDPEFWKKVLNAEADPAVPPPGNPPDTPNYSDVESGMKEGDLFTVLYNVIQALTKDAEETKSWASTYVPLPKVEKEVRPAVSTGKAVTPPKTVPAFLWDQALALAVLTGNMAAEAIATQGVSGLDAQRWISAYVNLIRTLADIARGAEE